jgi:hypothetical protein
MTVAQLEPMAANSDKRVILVHKKLSSFDVRVHWNGEDEVVH